MTYTLIPINRKKLTIMGVPMPNQEFFDSLHSAIASNIYEGLYPTKKEIEIIRDFCLDKISKGKAISLMIGDSHE